MNSWSIYRRPEIHWASISRHGTEAWFEAKFIIRLRAETGLYGYYVERSNDPKDTKVDWLNLLNWLAVEERVVWLHRLLEKEGMRIFDPYPDYDDMAFNRTIRPHAKGWKVEVPGRKGQTFARIELSVYLAEVKHRPGMRCSLLAMAACMWIFWIHATCADQPSLDHFHRCLSLVGLLYFSRPPTALGFWGFPEAPSHFRAAASIPSHRFFWSDCAGAWSR